MEWKTDAAGRTSLCDIEIFIDTGLSAEKVNDKDIVKVDNKGIVKVNDKVSIAAINCKFVYEDGGSHKVTPESEHDNPWIFIIDKCLNEFFLPVEKGKTHFNINREGYNERVTVESFLLQLVKNLRGFF